MIPDPKSPIVDLAILGGGIAGAGVLREAASRGASAILFEKSDFGSATSSKSSKLIHGGIRYLELAWEDFMHGRFDEGWKNFRFVFSALRECRILENIAGDLVHPLPFVIPIYKEDKRSKWTIFLGASLYSLLAFLSGSRHAPKFFFSKESVLQALPGLRQEGLTGGILYWDRRTDDRALVQATIRSAEKLGAKALSHAKLVEYEFSTVEQCFLLSVQEASGQVSMHRSRHLVNATGPWVDAVRQASERNADQKLVMPIAGSHLMLRKFLPTSLLLQAPDKRIFFCINIGEQCRVGTTERRHDAPDTVSATDAEIDYLLEGLNRYFPDKSFTRADILSSDAGIRPLAFTGDHKNPNKVSREHEIVRGSHGEIHLVGVKLTDYRRAGKDVVDTLFTSLQRFNPAVRKESRTHLEKL